MHILRTRSLANQVVSRTRICRLMFTRTRVNRTTTDRYTIDGATIGSACIGRQLGRCIERVHRVCLLTKKTAVGKSIVQKNK